MTAFIVQNTGRPVASATDIDDAKIFAYRNTTRDRHPAAEVSWTETGKMFVGGQWNGWEIVPVAEVGRR